MAAWPSYARIQFSGFSIDRESASKRSDMERGPAKQRLIRSHPMKRLNVTILLVSLADYNAFSTWYETDIQLGTLFFDMPDPTMPTTIRQFRFVDGLKSETPLNGALTAWQAQAQLEYWT